VKNIKRVPVTDASFERRGRRSAGVIPVSESPQAHKMVKTGMVDSKKTRRASLMAGGSGWGYNRGTNSVFNNSYASSGNMAAPFGDMPMYFAMMNEANGGLLYWPVTLKEKYEWYRYFTRTDAFVGQAVDLHVELPMSKIMLNMPQMKDKKRRAKIFRRYEAMCKKLKMFQKLQSVLLEYVVIGNCFIFFEWDEKEKNWRRMIILPPEEVDVQRYPCSEHSRVEYRPDRLMGLVNKLKGMGCTLEQLDRLEDFKGSLDDSDRRVLEMIPRDLLRHVFDNNTIIMDTDPYTGDGKDSVGSYVYHLARRRPEYFDLGISILERVLVPLLIREHYKYTQLSLASRNMTPRNKISAPDIDESALDMLREQVDLSMLDPDFSIVTNYDWSWDQIGPEQRLLDLSRENEALENQMFAGLGVTRELLTGEGLYSGGRITVEILNTRFLLVREILVDMIEENLFKPMADANGDYEDDEDGNRRYYYPRVSFNRLTIRDNQEVFDSLFQLYQKGSLPVSFILEMFNLDPDKVSDRLQDDLFTVKDAVFNDLVRSIYQEAGRTLVERTDIVERIAATLKGPDGKKLTWTEAPAEDGTGGAPGGFGDFGGAPAGDGADTGEAEPSTGEETPPDDGVDESAGPSEPSGVIDAFVKEMAAGLDPSADRDTIIKALRKKLEGKASEDSPSQP
jgi:hypothetical protein